MKLSRLFRRALYRELRSAVGYYDARRIMRAMETGEAVAPKDLGKILREAGFDERHVEVTMKITDGIPFPMSEGT